MTVQIGSLTNVPAPGDDVRSPWAQDVTKLGMHTFADKATLDAQWGTAANGSHAWTTAERKVWIRYGGTWQWAPWAQGIIDYGAKGADSGPAPFTTITNLDSTVLRVDVVLPSTRLIRVTGWCRAFTAATGTERCDFVIRQIAPSDTTVASATAYGVASGVGGPCPFVQSLQVLAAGTYAWVLAGLRVGGGSGNFTWSGAVGFPTTIIAEDMGAA